MKGHLAVMGAGHVGLVVSAGFAEMDHDVICYDVDTERIKGLRNGFMPLAEPRLEHVIDKHASSGRLHFTTEPKRALQERDIIFIAVGTPAREDGTCDLSQVCDAAHTIGNTIVSDTTVVIKSTVPVGTGERIQHELDQQLDRRFEGRSRPVVSVGSNPEFLQEGSAVENVLNPDRIVIGAGDSRIREEIAALYEPLDAPVVKTKLRDAELIKYASNSFLATKISFINEMANIAEHLGSDVEEVAKGLGMDERIASSFLQAGVGFGGSCFPKDVRALIHQSVEQGYEPTILREVTRLNQRQRRTFAHIILRHLPSNGEEPVVGVWGLSFKPGTDDMRDAPSIDIVQTLRDRGLRVRAYDPVAMDNAQNHLPGIDWASDPYEAVEGALGLVLITEWPEFLQADFERVRRRMKGRWIFDGRNALPMNQLSELGFRYRGMGRRPSPKDSCTDRVPDPTRRPDESDRETVLSAPEKTSRNGSNFITSPREQ